MKLRAALAVVAALVSIPCFAVETLGDRTCSAWTSNRAEPTANLAASAWLSGLMSGLAIGARSDVLKYTNGEPIRQWMDAYCRAHPQEHVSTGATILFSELRAKAPKQ